MAGAEPDAASMQLNTVNWIASCTKVSNVKTASPDGSLGTLQSVEAENLSERSNILNAHSFSPQSPPCNAWKGVF